MMDEAWDTFQSGTFITRPHCALDSKHVPLFQRQVIKQFSNYRWIPFTKFPRFPRTNTCKVKLVCSFDLLRIAQQAKIASFFEFQNCERMDSAEKCFPQM